ncbi:MAG: tyrosine-type recombinase/integrase [Hyphomicrobiaceae bacterium]|nr:tyrosine-type recombinase/integrase [Hyphomicrobiaceae bacterium]
MRNLASNTIGNALRALQLLLSFLDRERIDLIKRFQGGQVLRLHEVEALVQACRQPLATSEAASDDDSFSSGPHRWQGVRGRLRDAAPTIVHAAVTATRLQCIRDYVRWSAELHLDRSGTSRSQRAELRAAVDTFVLAVEARIPSGGTSEVREGLAPDLRQKLREVTRPDSPENPWNDRHARIRNALIVDWLYDLGLRRGELLSVRSSDLDFRRGVVTISRRPDDPSDPRRNQPVVKTRGRELPLSAENLDATRHYIINIRGSLLGARRHEYLFVASDTGTPLSMPALAKIFRVLRSKIADLPDQLSPHILRHTWNDRFSEEMDRENVPEDTEKKARSYLMGWSETSGTAGTYTRRHVREKAKRVSLDLQEKMLGKKVQQ